MKNIVLLGSTGSIGTQTLDVVRSYKEDLHVVALAAGNSVVFKPSSNCVLSCVKLFEIFEKIGMPKGSVNLILGPGGITGNRIAESKDVDMVTLRRVLRNIRRSNRSISI